MPKGVLSIITIPMLLLVGLPSALAVTDCVVNRAYYLILERVCLIPLNPNLDCG